MPRIPAIERFRGDNEQSFGVWVAMLEAQMNALETADDKRRETLLCCLQRSAFATATAEITENNEITYDELKDALKTRYSGDDYKRPSEQRLRNLKFKPGMKINLFVHDLKTVIKELYDIVDTNAVDLIAQNHVLAQLDTSIQEQAKILQLSGNCKLESILELVNSRAAGNILHSTGTAPSFASASGVSRQNFVRNNDTRDVNRLDTLENKFDLLTRKLDTLLSEKESSNRSRNRDRSQIICDNCHKDGHPKERCYKLKECYNCHRVGHIAKFCRTPAQATAIKRDINSSKPCSGSTNIDGEGTCGEDILPETSRIVIKLNIGETSVDLLYDLGSTYTTLTRETYDSLKRKPPLTPIAKSGVTVSGEKFQIDGVAFVNIKFKREDSSQYLLEYQPVLVS